jgi:hypothetical protein
VSEKVLIIDDVGSIPTEVWNSLERDVADARSRIAAEAERIEAQVDPIGRVIRRVLSDGISTKDGCA